MNNPKPPLNSSRDTLEKLKKMMDILNIKSAFYIDDYNGIDNFATVSHKAKSFFTNENFVILEDIFGKELNLQVPDENVFEEELARNWQLKGEEDQREIIYKIHELSTEGFERKDFDRTKELESSFPKNMLQIISPDDWDSTFEKIKKTLTEKDKVLLLFDQDLKEAREDRFKSGTEKGQHLIQKVRKSEVKDNFFCALITHLISDTSEELLIRDAIIEELQDLKKEDFFALTKSRIRSPELLCDGIKKVLLNEFCESMKQQSVEILKDAQKSVIIKLQNLDTYDFDHTVLRSSYGEGVWEVDTLFRITNNFYEDELRNRMANIGLAKKINPAIKKAKEISDIRFEIPPNLHPYKEAYELRHNDIYFSGDTINTLHLPLENGDIFEIENGKGKGTYILVSQECDLAIRNSGRRFSINSVLLKIMQSTREELKINLQTSDSYFENKFRLDYFSSGLNDVGIVKFLDAHIVDLNAVDLCVFNSQGRSIMNLNEDFDIDLVSTSWENRWKKLHSFYSKKSVKLEEIVAGIASLENQGLKREILKQFSLPLAPISGIGSTESFNDKSFNFGLRRVMRLKPNGAKALLDKYYKHLSRVAEPHDFARHYQ